MTIKTNSAFFDGNDSGLLTGLWVTDGTPAGAVEIGGIGSAGIAHSSTTFGISAAGTLTAFHTAFFNGIDSTDNTLGNLWVSDGSATGTVEVGGLMNAGIAGANASFNPQGFTWYRGKVLFAGTDTSNDSGLWITDGTAAGTTEIGGIGDHGVSNANATGLNPFGMVVFNGKTYFRGQDSSNKSGLWVTDGTAAGTTEIGGAGSTGIAGVNAAGFNPTVLGVAGGRLFLEGGDTSSFGLWVSDGTAAGTVEIGGLGSQGVTGVPATGLGANLFAQLNGNAFFLAQDSAGGFGLWTSDGTTAGTVEIGGLNDHGVTGAAATGLSPNPMVRLGTKIIFAGNDSNNNRGLWVTDGTAAGTFEIGGLNDHGVAGANASGLQPSNLAVLDGKVLFQGDDSSGNFQLWETDGTVAGTVVVASLASGGLMPNTIATPFTVTGTSDFNGDFYSDVLWRNSSGGLSDWSMNAGTIVAGAALTQGGVAVNPDASWSVAGIADFDGNGSADVLWRNSDGTLADWSLNGSNIVSSAAPTSGGVVVKPDASWSIAGTADFNGDGSADLLWRNTSGEVSAWLMNGSTIVGSGDLTSGGVAVKPDASWSVAGVGDFDGDGKKDILWRNTSGEVTAWFMNGTTIASSGDLTSGGVAVRPDASWSVVGIGDFNGDGNSDLLWRNANGSLQEWQMAGTTIASSGSITFNGAAITPDATWHVVEIGDFNGDGSSDILWRNDNGSMSEWLMNGTTISQSLTPTSNGAAVSPGATWSAQEKPTNFG
jgi:ELWxxDGT repeat protein